MSFWREIKKPITCLAPMRGVTDVVFREIVAQCGKPDVFFTEFVNVESLFSQGREKLMDYLIIGTKDRPLVAQVWGVEPDKFYKASKYIKELGFDGIDINMGCPARKILSKGACSALINNQKLAEEIIQATKDGAEEMPVSVKTRIGFEEPAAETWCRFLLEQNIEVLTIHGRTTKQGYSGLADWDEIKKVVQIRDEIEKETLIIGNGDVSSMKDLYKRFQKYSVDGVMIGQAVMKDPFFFNEKISVDQLSKEKRIKLLVKHLKLYKQIYNQRRPVHIIKKLFDAYIANFTNASELRNELMQIKDVDEGIEILLDI
jgi:nifR3 family TIM-barrel protein